MNQFLHTITDRDKTTLCFPAGTHPSGTDFTVKYHTLNGNNPMKRGDYIGLWETENRGRIPANTRARESYLVGISSADSNKTLLDLPIGQNEYVLGYCHGADPKTHDFFVSATLSIPSGAFDPEKALMQSVELDIKGNEASIWLEYTAISNTNPKASGSWVGIWIWKGDMASVLRDVPVYNKHVESSASSGKLPFDNLLRRGTEYLLCYFLDGLNKETGSMDFSKLAAWIIFETDQ